MDRVLQDLGEGPSTSKKWCVAVQPTHTAKTVTAIRTGPLNSSMMKMDCQRMMRFNMAASLLRTAMTAV